MRTLFLAMVCVGVLAFSSSSQAAQISSPTIFGTAAETRAECVVVNGGNTPLTVTLKIFDDFGNQVATSNCGGPVSPGQFCSLFTPIDNAEAHACIATAGSVANLRGALLLFERVVDSFGLIQLRAVRSTSLR